MKRDHFVPNQAQRSCSGAASGARQMPGRTPQTSIAGLLLLLVLLVGTSCSRSDPAPPKSPHYTPNVASQATGGSSHQNASAPERTNAEPPEKKLPPVVDIADQAGDGDAVALFPDGKFIAVCGDEGKVRIYELQEAEPISTWDGLPGRPQLALSPDGKWLAQASNDRPEIIVWNMVTKELARTLRGHEQPIVDLAFSADGQRLATCGATPAGAAAEVAMKGSVKIWDLAGDESAAPLSLPAVGAVRAAFSPDGATLAVARRRSPSAQEPAHSDVGVWHLATQQLTTTWENVQGGTYAVAFSPDGKTLAIAERNGPRSLQRADRVRLVDPESGAEMGILWGHSGEIHGLGFSPDGLLLVTAGRDGMLRVFQVQTRSQRAVIDLKGFRGGELSFSQDGSRFALPAGNGSREIHPTVWELAYAVQGQSVQRGWTPFDIAILHQRSSRQIKTLAFSGDGTRLASSDDTSGTWLYDVKTGNGRPVNGAANFIARSFTSDLSTAVILDNKVHLREMRPDGATRDLDDPASINMSDQRSRPGGGTMTITGPIQLIHAASASPDGRYVATSHSDLFNGRYYNAGVVRIRDWKTLAPVTAMQIPEGHPSLLAASKDGRWLAVGGGDGFKTRFIDGDGPVSMFDLSNQADRQKWRMRSLEKQVRRPSSEAVAAACAQAAKIYQDGGTEQELAAVLRPVAGELHEINVSPEATDLHWQLLTLNRSKTQFDAVKFRVSADNVDVMWSAIFSPWVVDGGVIPIDPANRDYQQSFILSQNTARAGRDFRHQVTRAMRGPAIRADQEFIVWFALGANQEIPGRVAVNLVPKGLLADEGWVTTPVAESYGTLPIVPRKHLLFHGSGVTALSLSQDAATLATSGEDDIVKVWDVATERVMSSVAGSVAALSPDGTQLATGGVGEDGTTVTLWDTRSGKRLHRLQGGHFLGISAIAFSPDGARLASGGREGIIALWDVSTGNPVWPE